MQFWRRKWCESWKKPSGWSSLTICWSGPPESSPKKGELLVQIWQWFRDVSKVYVPKFFHSQRKVCRQLFSDFCFHGGFRLHFMVVEVRCKWLNVSIGFMISYTHSNLLWRKYIKITSFVLSIILNDFRNYFTIERWNSCPKYRELICCNSLIKHPKPFRIAHLKVSERLFSVT